MKNPALKKELVIFPLLIAAVVVFVIPIGLMLLRPAGSWNVAEGVAALGVFLAAYIALIFAAYSICRKPTEKRYASLAQIGSECSAFNFWTVLLFAALYVPLAVVFVCQPLSAINARLSLFEIHPTLAGLVPVLLAFLMASYTYSSIMWRYLREDAKEKHRLRALLAWPYKMGWMNPDKLA